MLWYGWMGLEEAERWAGVDNVRALAYEQLALVDERALRYGIPYPSGL